MGHSHPVESTFIAGRRSVHVGMQIQVNQAEAVALSQVCCHYSQLNGAISPDDDRNEPLLHGFPKMQLRLLHAANNFLPMLSAEMFCVWKPPTHPKVSDIHYRQTFLAQHVGKSHLPQC